ncbi:flagellar protein FlaG [Bacillus massiliigorillae]|uniref:flagellar protein FlaG n=1 Tax=Bacillus massiliigorillae TaxID=1243664 RepID=UPI0003A3DA16|nr:flagellar protein FlaG [Bacillus massiliigorillae]
MIDKTSLSAGTFQSNMNRNLDSKVERGSISENIEQPESLLPNNQIKENLSKVVDSMNQFLQPSNTHLKFEFHDELQEYYVAIVDNKTDEVIKEIPPKKLLDMYAAMTEFLGVLVDKKI